MTRESGKRKKRRDYHLRSRDSFRTWKDDSDKVTERDLPLILDSNLQYNSIYESDLPLNTSPEGMPYSGLREWLLSWL